MQWIGTLFLTTPMVCIVALVMVAFFQGLRWRLSRSPDKKKCMHRTGAAYALGVAFLCFSTYYHPRLELASIAQIRQQEQEDDEGHGDPDSPLRHLLRQLRRIRRGDPVDRLVWRLE